jgi:hypothetical protein
MPTQTEVDASKTYNGWANWETWNVALWFGNDETLYRAVLRQIEHRGAFTSDSARGFVRALLPDGTKDAKQPRGWAMYDVVDWKAIADDFNEMGE